MPSLTIGLNIYQSVDTVYTEIYILWIFHHQGYPITYNVYFFFVYLGFYVAFNTVQVISRRVVGRAEETST